MPSEETNYFTNVTTLDELQQSKKEPNILLPYYNYNLIK